MQSQSQQHRNTQVQIEWRRSKVAELDSQGHNQQKIAAILHVSIGTICRDSAFLREQAKENIRKYIDERLPVEYEKCMVGLTAILREAWAASRQAQDKRERIQALSLAKECDSMKLDLLTNATVVDDAIRFVSSNNGKEELKSASNGRSEHNSESNEPDYDEDEDQLEQEQEGQITTATTNHVF